ncbi:MAG TPA: replication-relaxation family protein [Candidatus Sulfotelmatobacter sp.]|nr:replication-relaxation family protein [Candidatus Sulfotelmatobacter sp.]
MLQELAMMRVIDREQAKIIGNFGSTTRVNKRLLALTRGGLLKRFFIGSGGWKKSLYSLSPAGALFLKTPYRGLRTRSNDLIAVSSSLEHQLGINELYCIVKYRYAAIDSEKLIRWDNVYHPIDSQRSLIPDAYIEILGPEQTIAAFLELDLGHENLVVWKKKVEKYLRYAISGEFEPRIHHPQFRVLVVANSDTRVAALRHATADITDKIFWFTTMESIKHDGFWAPIWLRSTREDKLTPL